MRDKHYLLHNALYNVAICIYNIDIYSYMYNIGIRGTFESRSDKNQDLLRKFFFFNC